MLMGPDNFLTHVKRIVTGGGNVDSQPANDAGFLRDVPYPVQAIATTGTRATAENSVPADAIVIDADGEDVIPSFMIPRDYDEATDHLKCTLLVAYVSGTSVVIGPTAVSRGNASTVWADESSATHESGTLVNAAFSIGEIETDLSGLAWKRNDALAVNFAASSATSTPVAHVLGVRWEYRSTLVSYNETDASDVDLR